MGRILGERRVATVFVIVSEACAYQPGKMAIAQHDHVLEQLAAKAPDPSLCHGMLPGTAA